MGGGDKEHAGIGRGRSEERHGEVSHQEGDLDEAEHDGCHGLEIGLDTNLNT